MTDIRIVIDVKGIENLDGEPITDRDTRHLTSNIENDIRNRLFGEGLLPHDMQLDTWDMEVKVIENGAPSGG